MSDPEQPKTPRKGQFQKGNKASKGRPKGAENKFGPGFREKLLAGIIASGEKKARKAGVNGKIDGFAYFVESLVDGSAGAAATLIAKMLPSEPLPAPFTGPGMIVNVRAVAEGQAFCPGNEVLMPYEMATEAWAAHNGGAETWTAYLTTIEPKLTKAAYESLSRVPALERAKLVLDETPMLHLVPKAPAETPEALIAEIEAFIAQVPGDEELPKDEETRLLAEVEALARRMVRLAKSEVGEDATLAEIKARAERLVHLARSGGGDDAA